MSGFLTRISNMWKQNPYLASFAAIILIAPLLVFSFAPPTRTGTKTQCKYNHLIEDDTHIRLVWRWQIDENEVKNVKSICDRHKKLEALLWQAKSAKTHKDTERAERLVNEIKKIDPTFRPAEVAAVIGAPAPAGTTPAGETPPPAAPGETAPPGEKPVFSGELTAVFPKTLAGYDLINDSPGSISASRMYKADANAHPKVDLLTIQASQTGTDASAEAYIANNIKSYYAALGKAVTINGANGYFGTDGGSLAILAYPVKGVLIELEMSAAGGSADGLYDDLIELSKIIP